MPAKKRTEAEWEAIMAAQQASGLKQIEWCEANGVNYHTFLDRARRIRRKQGTQAQIPQWVEARPAPETQQRNPIHIELGSFRVIVPDNFNEAALLRVCKVLVELC